MGTLESMKNIVLPWRTYRHRTKFRRQGEDENTFQQRFLVGDVFSEFYGTCTTQILHRNLSNTLDI